jgi:hypothetical protein
MSGSGVRRDTAALSSGCKSRERPARPQLSKLGDLCRQLRIRTASISAEQASTETRQHNAQHWCVYFLNPCRTGRRGHDCCPLMSLPTCALQQGGIHLAYTRWVANAPWNAAPDPLRSFCPGASGPFNAWKNLQCAAACPDCASRKLRQSCRPRPAAQWFAVYRRPQS